MGSVTLGPPFKLHNGLMEKGYRWGLLQEVSSKVQFSPIWFG